MCLVGVALGMSRRYPLVVASNRDEYMDRPSQALDWWSPWPEGPAVLSGRDLQAGGTWMGLSQAGRFALVTNVRQPFAVEPDAPSRGQIPLGWLRGDLPADRFWPRTALSGHAPFNLLAADFPAGEFFWTSNQHPHPQRLTRGVHGLSNAALDTPWPKVERIKQRLSAALGENLSLPALCSTLFEALADDTPAPDAELPQTGVGPAVERMLSPVFIRSPDGRYGTRCSTLLVCEAQGRKLTTHMIERQHPVAEERAFRLDAWPPTGLPLPSMTRRR